MARNNNEKVLPAVQNALEQMKYEIAGELGITDYNNVDKGTLSSRANGYVGGNITKRLVALGQQSLINQGQQAIQQTSQNIQLDTPQQ